MFRARGRQRPRAGALLSRIFRITTSTASTCHRGGPDRRPEVHIYHALPYLRRQRRRCPFLPCGAGAMRRNWLGHGPLISENGGFRERRNIVEQSKSPPAVSFLGARTNRPSVVA